MAADSIDSFNVDAKIEYKRHYLCFCALVPVCYIKLTYILQGVAMLLGRFINHFKEQNWFAVCLDVIVVIVGIFLGLQVTNWQEHLNEQEDARQYLSRLNDDLEADLQNITYREEFWTAVANYGVTAMKYMENPDKPYDDYWQIVLATFQASQMAPLEVTDVTYKEMQQAGQLGLIGSQPLRRQMAEYYSFNSGITALTLLKVNPPYREYVRGKFPSHVSEYIWSSCFNAADFTFQKLEECDAPIPEVESKALLEQINADPRVLELLRSWHATMIAATDLLPQIKMTAINIQSLVTQELGQ